MKTYLATNRPARINHTPRIIAFMVLVLLLLCAVARGRAQAVEKAAASPVGVYQLMSVDGRSVPGTINHEGTVMNVHSGSLTITTNHQITSVMTISVGDRQNVRVETHAAYTVKNSELAMKWQNAGLTKALWPAEPSP